MRGRTIRLIIGFVGTVVLVISELMVLSASSRSGGSGLEGLNDRVVALGGYLLADSPPGQGTRIVAEIPLD